MLKTREFVRETMEQHSLPTLKGPLLAVVHYRIPASVALKYKRRRDRHLLPHTTRPDGDNLEKFLNDAMNGLLWEDDSRIVWLLRSKTVTAKKEGETILFVREIPNEIPNYSSILSDIMEHIEIEKSELTLYD